MSEKENPKQVGKRKKPKPGFGPVKKEAPKRKLPKKTQRPKRRYVLFQLANVSNSKKAFDLVMNTLSLDERKEIGLWFIEFKKETGKGIVRFRLGNEAKAKKAILSLPKEFGPKTLKISGTLKSLRVN